MSESAVADTVAMTVHGPSGAVDLVVPMAAAVSDVAREYAAQCGSVDLPRLFTTAGRALDPSLPIARAGVRSGGVLIASLDLARRVAVEPGTAPPPGPVRVGRTSNEAPASALPVVLGALAAVLAGLLAVHTGPGGLHDATLALLVLGAAIGVVPFGRRVHHRGVAAPAFGAAAAYLIAWQPEPATLPLAFGIAGLGAALVAGVARASGAGPAVVHDVWMITGVGVFAMTGVGVLAGFPVQVSWAVLVIVALLASRSVAAVAIDVPDQMLIDLERLAVTAWSARDRPRGRRGRMMIRESGVTDILTRGTLIVESAAVAILIVVLVAVPNLLRTATFDVDRQGARVLVFAAGAALLLAARSFRHPRARAMLRCAGLFAWVALLVALLDTFSNRSLLYVLGTSLTIAAAVFLAAVATGRGWRSAKWASRAEVTETLAGAIAIGALAVATGLVRMIWEIPFAG